MRFSNLVPMLQTADMDSTIGWYEAVLGFKLESQMEQDWCCLVRDDVSIMFMDKEHPGEPQATATQYIYVDDVMGLWNSIKDRIAAEWGPEKFEYGMLEFAIKDPNGYLLSFGQPTS